MSTDSNPVNARAATQSTYSPFLPLLLATVALLFWVGFQTFQLKREDSALKEAFSNQEQLVQNSTKMRKSLETMASETKRLADQGNPNARLLVDELKKRGVSINPNSSSQATTGVTATP